MYFTLLDIVRFLSAIGVLFHHTFGFYYGKLGVYLFFIISGFVIYFSLKRGLKDYVLSRFLRLYPMFWVCAIITYLVTLFYGDSISIQHFIIGLFMVNSGRMETMIDGSYWTLTFELLFYCYMGLFVWIFSKEKLIWFYSSWLLISFFSFFFGIDQLFFIKLLSIRFAPYFVFGGVLALIVENYTVSSLGRKGVYLTTLTGAALLPIYVSKKLLEQKDTITNFTGSFGHTELLIVESFFIIIPLVVLLSSFSFANGKRFSKIAFALGGITYPLYLLHWKIGKTFLSQYQEYETITPLSVAFALLLVGFSYILSVYELPIRKYLKKTFENFL
jgi:peptidoglycan/LPS O-acetylase OafA/YrhL